MAQLQLTAEAERVFNNHRAIDLFLEREYRRLQDSDADAQLGEIIVDLQIATVKSCFDTLVHEFDVDPSSTDLGLYGYIAEAFAEHCELRLSMEASLA